MKIEILRTIIIFVIIVTSISCSNDCIDGFEHLGTETLAKNVHIERYYLSDGVYGGGIQKYFLTDSISNRSYLGHSEDKEYVNFSIVDNRLRAEKHTRRNLRNGESVLKSVKFYKIPK